MNRFVEVRKEIFGDDYMMLPPKEKQRPGHTADYIDFGEDV